MILFDLTGNENHPAYQDMEISNGNRQYDFLRSVVLASVQIAGPFLSHALIKALNHHAITCLHISAGDYRPCAVHVGDHDPPEFYRVEGLMDDFVNRVNRYGEAMDPVALAAFVLWRINFIHPFINGNGRTARAACYLVLCVKLGGWLPGETILPELLRRERDAYVVALREVDAAFARGTADLSALHELLERLLREQLQSAGINPAPQQPPPAAPALPAPQP